MNATRTENSTRELKQGISVTSNSPPSSYSKQDTNSEETRLTSDTSMEESRVTTDAIHPRFQDRTHLLFKCRSCGVTKAKERKMQKHFLQHCPASFIDPKYSCPLPECGGPSFVYQFKSELHIYHSCAEWAKFCKTRTSSYTLSNSSSNFNSSTSDTSLSTSKLSFDESSEESRENGPQREGVRPASTQHHEQ